ncbi:piercer of microtubule wall 1 protein-like [Calliopsis andreniformis]|uniref:piercer of microtubule wall 1 protein-like n=1 Tax=Calliopsis andreniformis TaxID=337506 RepID=UPI003FCD3120
MIETPCVCGEKERKESALGPRTDDIYRTCNLPTRFMYPRIFKGYRQDDSPLPHPCYKSTAMDYGWYAPTIHTVPTTYYPRNTSFSDSLAQGGMYRNCSLNTELDKSIV